MSRKRITTAGDSATVLLPQERLDLMGVAAGDEVDVSVVDGTLIVRSLAEAERAQQIAAATQSVLERRQSAYEELAKGAE